MSVSNALRRIAEVIDGVEAEDVEVRDAAMPTERAAISDGKVHVTLDLAITLDDVPDQNTEKVESTANGSDQAVVSGVVSEPTETNASESESHSAHRSNGQDATEATQDHETESPESESASLDVEATTEEPDDGKVVCPEPDCDETFESEPGMKIHRTKIHLRGQDTDDSSDATPAYRDPEALEEVYEAHDSFPAMREALDVDVSAQTIRRHMIQHGIHDPSGDEDSDEQHESNTPDEAGAADESESDAERETDEDHDREPDEPDAEHVEEPESVDEDGTETEEHEEESESEEEPVIPESAPLAETLPADVTAPADITFAELKEAVRTADTLYHIQQQFDLTREEARDLLGYLDLLELVLGRVATKHEREELKAEIDSRIRHSIRGTGTSA